jgi:pyruvate,water dikinase
MGITQIWGALFIFFGCPIIGALPLIDWITYSITGKDLKELGTGNVSVSAAFYHGGQLSGILAVLSEASKGILAIIITRSFFPTQSTWEILALIALVMGRYWGGKGAGATNVTWGMVVHNPIAALLILLIGGISFTIFREQKSARLALLGLMVVILSSQHPHDPPYIIATISLASLLGWIYRQIPDDLDLSTTKVNPESAKMFRFFRGTQGVLTLDQVLGRSQVGGKAANLSQLKQWGYNVPDGWVLKPGDDLDTIVEDLAPSLDNPLVVRSSAFEEDSPTSSAAGIYMSFLNLTNTEALKNAILECFASYHTSIASEYRQSKSQLKTQKEYLAVMVQKQIKGVFSGVAFSRDPVNQLEDRVCIEALPGQGLQVVSGKNTPEQYRVYWSEQEAKIEGEGSIPDDIILTVAKVAREIEHLYHDIPQDLEWTYDGERLWLLQTRTITNLQPLWTRKIAAEVIPGVISPLTWSINQPLTCGVWGDIFKIVLGARVKDLDFNETATLHYQRAYFNATLLGTIFRRMGLPPESLEFLTRGSKFSKPPLRATLRNLLGLWRLLQREWRLAEDFARDYDRDFAPILDELTEIPPSQLSPSELLVRINHILLSLKTATYYSILAPLSFALRQVIFRVAPEDLDNSKIPEIASIEELKYIALQNQKLFSHNEKNINDYAAFFALLAEIPDGEATLNQFHNWLNKYGYLSEVATDIFVPRWSEDCRIIRDLFTQYIALEPQTLAAKSTPKFSSSFWVNLVQRRLDLKGKVSEIYSKLLAHLRYTVIALAQQWQDLEIISDRQDIFWLRLPEIKQIINNSAQNTDLNLKQLIKKRKFEWSENKKITHVPYLVYGNSPSVEMISNHKNLSVNQRLTGIGASAGIVEGKVKILHSISQRGNIENNSILVVPYTDAGWCSVLPQAKGLIAEVGGKLSHGAIIAREYNIPAVMDINLATQILKDGQWVRIDGQKGIVEILDL